MATKVLIDDRHRHRGSEYISLNPKLRRILLYKKGYQVLRDNFGGDVDFVQVLTDDEQPHFFWMRPCNPDAPGARKMDKTSTNTRTLSIRALLKELNWKPTETVRLRLEWDKREAAARIDIREGQAKS